MTTTFVAGLRHDGIVAPLVIDQPMNGDRFVFYLTHCLAPTLSPGDIVVMDNLPAYSPDLNPIELVFSKLKTLLRDAAERTVDGLWRRIGIALDTFSSQECTNYFRHAGYQTS